jgi:hypothetical protein
MHIMSWIGAMVILSRNDQLWLAVAHSGSHNTQERSINITKLLTSENCINLVKLFPEIWLSALWAFPSHKWKWAVHDNCLSHEKFMVIKFVNKDLNIMFVCTWDAIRFQRQPYLRGALIRRKYFVWWNNCCYLADTIFRELSFGEMSLIL